MKIIPCRNGGEAGALAANAAMELIRQKPSLLLCAASGQSTVAMYASMAERKESFPTSDLRIVKLDEWGGLADDDPRTCSVFIREHLLKPLGIPTEHYFGFDPAASEPDQECARISERLRQEGPIDLCVLGLGRNGHIAFNEPADFLQPACHVAQLSLISQGHAMVQHLQDKPSYGLTLGMADILAARKIQIIITGEGKEEVKREFLTGRLSTHLPASFLWLHPNVDCYIA